jgi:hypothetical protein
MTGTPLATRARARGPGRRLPAAAYCAGARALACAALGLAIAATAIGIAREHVCFSALPLGQPASDTHGFPAVSLGGGGGRPGTVDSLFGPGGWPRLDANGNPVARR